MALNMQYEMYRQNSITTSNPRELTLMLYNGLVKFIVQAQLAIEDRNMEKAHTCIVKAKRIILNFENTLDMRYEVSKGLLNIYEYMYKRLTHANIKKDRDALQEVLGFAKELRDTWAEAMKIARAQ